VKRLRKDIGLRIRFSGPVTCRVRHDVGPTLELDMNCARYEWLTRPPPLFPPALSSFNNMHHYPNQEAVGITPKCTSLCCSHDTYLMEDYQAIHICQWISLLWPRGNTTQPCRYHSVLPMPFGLAGTIRSCRYHSVLPVPFGLAGAIRPCSPACRSALHSFYCIGEAIPTS